MVFNAFKNKGLNNKTGIINSGEFLKKNKKMPSRIKKSPAKKQKPIKNNMQKKCKSTNTDKKAKTEQKKEIIKEIPKPKIRKEATEQEKKEISGIFSNALVRHQFIAIGGENSLDIVRNYPLDLSDEEMSKKLKVKISDVRSTLNKMHGEGFVNYSRKKDNETGWYSYSWSLNRKKIEEWADKITSEKKNNAGTGERYFCRKCGSDSIVEFVSAMENNFKCPCCSKTLEFLDSEKAENFELISEFMKKRRGL